MDLELVAVIYARVSSEEQGKGLSIEGQLETLKEACKRKGWYVIKEARELFTGTSDTRPELEQLLTNTATFDVLAVFSIDRLGRTLDVQRAIAKRLFDNKKYLYIQQLDTLYTDFASFDQILPIMLGTFAQIEHKLILSRTREGTFRAANSGGWVGGQPPYPYQLVRKEKVTKLIPHPERTEIVRRFIQLMIDGKGYRGSIIQIEKETGIRLHMSTVRRFIKHVQSFATGTFTIERTFKDGQKLSYVYSAEPIISSKTANEFLKKREGYYRTSRKYTAYASILKCTCGRHSLTTKRRPLLFCNSHFEHLSLLKGRTRCNGSISLKYMNAAMKIFLKKIQLFINDDLELIKTKLQKNIEQLEQLLLEKNIQLEQLDKEKQKVLDAYIKEEDIEIKLLLRSKLKELNKEINDISTEMKELTKLHDKFNMQILSSFSITELRKKLELAISYINDERYDELNEILLQLKIKLRFNFSLTKQGNKEEKVLNNLVFIFSGQEYLARDLMSADELKSARKNTFG